MNLFVYVLPQNTTTRVGEARCVSFGLSAWFTLPLLSLRTAVDLTDPAALTSSDQYFCGADGQDGLCYWTQLRELLLS